MLLSVIRAIQIENSLDFFVCQVNLLASYGVEHIVFYSLVAFPDLSQPFMYIVPFRISIRWTDVFPDREFPLFGCFNDCFFVEKHSGAYDLEVAAKEGFVGRHTVGTTVLEYVHEKCNNIVVGIVTECEVGKIVFPAQFKEALAALHGTVEAWRITLILVCVSSRAEVCEFYMERHAVFGTPIDERGMRVLIKAGIDVECHQFDRKWHNRFANGQDFQHEE